MSFREYPVNYPSLCVPNVDENITKGEMYEIFNRLQLGNIACVEMVRNVAFIHWKYWYNSREAEFARDKILSGKDFRVFYEGIRFWKVYPRQINISPRLEEPLRLRKEEQLRKEEKQRRREQEKERETLTREEIHALKVAKMVAEKTRQLAPPPMTKQARKVYAMKVRR
jgi:hypothetical protein